MASLVNDLGGPAGFGEYTLGPADDECSEAIDLTSIFANGVDFLGTTYTTLFVSNNGYFTFGSSSADRRGEPLSDSTVPKTAPFYSDIWTKDGPIATSPGGTSTGSDLVYYDVDSVSGVITATWDDVEAYAYRSDWGLVNAFQVQLVRVGGSESQNFDIRFIYENIDWIANSRIGYTDGAGRSVELLGTDDDSYSPHFENQIGEVTFHLAGGTIQGSRFAERLTGNVANDVLKGDGGNDVLVGGAGADVLDGGDGIDTASYDTATSGVTASLLRRSANTGDATGDQYLGIENLRGSTFDDTLSGDNNANTLYSNGGHDTFYGWGGNDTFVLSTYDAPALLNGGGGKDTLIIEYGEFYFNDSNFTAIEAVSLDNYAKVNMSGVTRGVTLISNSVGGGGYATLTGTQGNDVIIGGEGEDTLNGNDGNDRMVLSADPYTVDGGNGVDTLVIADGKSLSFQNTHYIANVERIEVGNNASIDLSQVGGAYTYIKSKSVETGSTSIIGTLASDRIYGGAGNDRISGGAGNDAFYAGSGSDTFVYDASGFGRDSLNRVDASKDHLDLSALATNADDLSFKASTDGKTTTIRINGDTADAIVLRGVTIDQAKADGFIHYGAGVDAAFSQALFNAAFAPGGQAEPASVTIADANSITASSIVSPDLAQT